MAKEVDEEKQTKPLGTLPIVMLKTSGARSPNYQIFPSEWSIALINLQTRILPPNLPLLDLGLNLNRDLSCFLLACNDIVMQIATQSGKFEGYA